MSDRLAALARLEKDELREEVFQGGLRSVENRPNGMVQFVVASSQTENRVAFLLDGSSAAGLLNRLNAASLSRGGVPMGRLLLELRPDDLLGMLKPMVTVVGVRS